jgi:hypothetical protein
MIARVWIKLLLRRFFLLPSFCRRCGRKVRDFVADDAAWERVRPLIKHGNTLCYDCFCDLTRSVYRLEPIA